MADKDGISDGNKVGKVRENLSKEENLSKVNPSRIRFLTLKASLALIYLRKTLTKAPIFYYFALERHILIATHASNFAIGGIFT